jgi:P27 family predicted phage terminase small subunit
MGKRGFVPKNKALRVLSGQLPVTTENMKDLDTQFEPPKPPSHFEENEIKIWNTTIELLRGMCVIEKIDQAVLGAYCDAFAKWQMSEREIIKLKRRKGIKALLVLGGNGNMTVHPWVTFSKAAQKDMVFYASQLGMTPAARLRVQAVPQRQSSNPFIKLKAGNDQGLDADSKGLRQIVEAEETRA